PGPPIIDSIILGLITLNVIWFPPSERNGEIINYKVCASLIGHPSICNNEPKTIPSSGSTIRGLNPGTRYAISLSASTGAGEGTAQNVSRETVRSALDGDVKADVTSNVAVSDTKTQIGFRLPSVNLREIGKIQRFDVIVKRWDTTKDKKTDLRNTPQSGLTHFNKSANGMKAYIAITKKGYENNMKIVVGDNSKSSNMSRRKRRNVDEYQNAPLIEDTQYAIFIRVFYNKDK
ncbi:receptor-type tyrosine- phosphatase eta-like isoform X1, partial [Paramuricea clavata]